MCRRHERDIAGALRRHLGAVDGAAPPHGGRSAARPRVLHRRRRLGLGVGRPLPGDRATHPPAHGAADARLLGLAPGEVRRRRQFFDESTRVAVFDRTRSANKLIEALRTLRAYIDDLVETDDVGRLAAAGYPTAARSEPDLDERRALEVMAAVLDQLT